MSETTRKTAGRHVAATSHDMAHPLERPPPRVTLTLYVDSSNPRCHGVELRLRTLLQSFASDCLQLRVRDLTQQAPFPEDSDVIVTPCIVLRMEQDRRLLILGNLRNARALALALADTGIPQRAAALAD